MKNLNFNQIANDERNIYDLRAIAGTVQFKNKVTAACHDVERFLKLSNRPIISCGGGKDSTAVALIAKRINPSLYILCANPPNPLPDREQHLINLKSYFGGTWIDIPYYWDVRAVLDGKAPYPDGLKMKILKQFQKDNGIDGIIMGVRNLESKGRAINNAIRGNVYEVKETWRCLPISRFTAEESLAMAMYFDAPINPVYFKTHLAPDYESLRDGTWWPHGMALQNGHGNWIKHYYPNLYSDYKIAERIMINKPKSNVCLF